MKVSEKRAEEFKTDAWKTARMISYLGNHMQDIEKISAIRDLIISGMDKYLKFNPFKKNGNV